MDLNKIGNFIRELRNEKGLSQTALAELIPITRQAVSRWEQGKSLPDSQTLILLSEIFNVSINEILNGERNSDNNQAATTLNLVDEYNDKKRKIQRITLLSVITIGTLLILFLSYYFFNSYNSIKVFRVRGNGDEFFTDAGIMITTKQKTYLRIGEIKGKNVANKIDSVKLYFKDDDGNEKTLYKDVKTDILITSHYGYDESFTEKELIYIKENLYLEINYKNSVEIIKLDVEKDFANNLFTYPKQERVLKKKEDNNALLYRYEEIRDAMYKKGIKEEAGYKLEVKDGNKTIRFISTDTELLVEFITIDYKEVWQCFFSNQFSYIYTKFTDDIESKRLIVDIEDDSQLKNEEKETYDLLVKYINNYLLEKQISNSN